VLPKGLSRDRVRGFPIHLVEEFGAADAQPPADRRQGMQRAQVGSFEGDDVKLAFDHLATFEGVDLLLATHDDVALDAGVLEAARRRGQR